MEDHIAAAKCLRISASSGGMSSMSGELFRELEEDLVPKTPTIGDKKRKKSSAKKTTAKKKTTPKPEEPSKERFPALDPFQDSASLVRFYRSVIKNAKKGVKFDTFESDARSAAVILDTLIEKERVGDRVFLRNWIEYYARHKLKGKKSQKIDNTSISAFGATFAEYDSKAVTSN